MFEIEERRRVSERIVGMARTDKRVVAGAVVGSLALGEGDRWSDIDLSFGVAEGESVDAVLDDWTRKIVKGFDAIVLFDLPVGSTIYRVYLLPDMLQLDLSFAPASGFVGASPRFRLIFGSAEISHRPPPSERDLLGWAVMYAKHARVCIERGRLWQAEFCITNVRHYTLSLACRIRELPASSGRGFDDLPSEILEASSGSFVISPERNELYRALGSAIDLLIRESTAAESFTPELRTRLLQFVRG